MRKSQHTLDYRKLTAALRRAREAAGLTQGQVARKLGVYASYISKVEAGERRIDVLELAALCRLYKISLVEFLRGVGLVD